MPILPVNQLRNLCYKILKAGGADDEQAKTVSEILVATSLHGVDSHGVTTIPELVNRLRKGVNRPDARISVLKETMTTAYWNGGAQFGHIVAKKAMEEATKKAESYGVGLVGTLGCHIGALYYYAMMAVRRDMIGVAAGRSIERRIVPHGGTEARLGTNPIAIGIPAGKERPILLDMATSIVAGGHVGIMTARGQTAPEKWFLEKDGTPTADPRAYTERRGTMIPFGTYKGYGLCLILDAIGMGLGATIPLNARGYGHIFLAIDPGVMVPIKTFKESVDELIKYVKSCPPQPGFKEVLIPGEPEFREEERRIREGIFIDDEFWRRFVEVGKSVGIDVDKEITGGP